jgi:Mg/Co/Ni transporter MgtE
MTKSVGIVCALIMGVWLAFWIFASNWLLLAFVPTLLLIKAWDHFDRKDK